MSGTVFAALRFQAALQIRYFSASARTSSGEAARFSPISSQTRTRMSGTIFAALRFQAALQIRYFSASARTSSGEVSRFSGRTRLCVHALSQSARAE